MQSRQFEIHHQAEQRHWWFLARRRIFRTLIDSLLAENPGGQLIDLGCGTGGNSVGLADGYRVAGVDPSAEAIEKARAYGMAGTEFFAGSEPSELPSVFREGDLYLCTDVLEHIEEERTFLEGWVEAAPSGAFFLLTVPADPALWSGHDVSHGHYRRYTMESWIQLWENLPLVPLLNSHFNCFLYPIIRAVRTFNRWRGESWGDHGTDLSIPWQPLNRMLETLFAHERHHLLAQLHGESESGFPFGASLISVLQKVDETCPA